MGKNNSPPDHHPRLRPRKPQLKKLTTATNKKTTKSINLVHTDNGAIFRLKAEVASNVKDEPVTDVRINICKKTPEVFLPFPHHPVLCYALPACLDSPTPSISDRFRIKASRLCSPEDCTSWVPLDFPIEQPQRVSLDSGISQFVCSTIMKERKQGFKFLTMDLSVTIQRNMFYDNGTERAILIHNIDSADDNVVEGEEMQCAVCFEKVERMGYHDCCLGISKCQLVLGVELCCSHVFHLRCIAPWLTKNGSCPLCRREQPACSLVSYY